MAIFYLDPVGGNDANNGTTFANRWKTVGSGATSARVAPGDVIRVMKSPDPFSIGSGQWTDNSGSITSLTMPNKVIEDCESGWVAATNITVAHNTGQKTGSARLNLTPAAGFTTGKMAHKQLPATLDLSAYQQISFWFQPAASSTRTYTLALCSDTNGDTPVNSFQFTENSVSTSGFWAAVVMDNGAALGSNINSIAIYADVDPGTNQTRFDNIVACKAPGAADELTHRSLIGKNTGPEPYWYPIDAITDNSVVIGASAASTLSSDQPMPYRGVTESVTTYIRNCFLGYNAGDRTVQDFGSSWDNPITFSGGWDSTNMSTQDGETWFTGSHFLTSAFTAASNPYIKLENIAAAHMVNGLVVSITYGWDIDTPGIIGCQSAFTTLSNSSSTGPFKFKARQVWGCNGGLNTGQSRPCEFDIGILHGDPESAVSSAGALIGSSSYHQPYIHKIGEISNNRSNGIYLTNQSIDVYGTTFRYNGDGDIRIVSTSNIAFARLRNCELLSPNPMNLTVNIDSPQVLETNIAGDPEHHKTTSYLGTFESQSAVVRTSPIAWALKPTAATHATHISDRFPVRFPLAKIAVNANKLVTVKAWVRRTNTALSAGLLVDGTELPGIARTYQKMTAAADTWEEVTLTFTPTTAGVVTIYAAGNGGNTHTAYFTDLTIGQAD